MYDLTNRPSALPVNELTSSDGPSQASHLETCDVFTVIICPREFALCSV